MELGLEKEPLIDPEVKAFVFSLVSALGGSSAGDDGRYVLGDDALAVLKDIKRWLRLYDDKTDRLDVARLLADANLVKGDLLEILAQWREDCVEGSFMSKIALLCVDLLMQLTWPIEMDEKRSIANRYLHIPTLQKAHVLYKQAVLHHDGSQILRTVIRVGVPAMAQPGKKRSTMEDNIIKVVLYLFRNIAMIAQPDDFAIDELERDVSRSATIDAFHQQDVFSLVLTVCSSMAEDFSTHDVEVLDLLYHLVKGVNVERLFMEKDELISSNTKELRGLISKEKGMLAGYARHAPSRHNRFGTMLWVKRDDGGYSTVFGQTAISNEQLTMAEMDNKKTWKKPRRPAKKTETDTASTGFDTAVPLASSARRQLRHFVEQFLDSSFNPLFTAVRRAIEREADRVLDNHRRQYLYLISWFLRAEAARRKKHASEKPQRSSMASSDVEGYTLIASVLDQETFVLLHRSMQSAQDEKHWEDLNAGMKCFTQILLTVQDMSESPLDEDQEIAENILSRIFYEQSTHDRVIGLLRTYKDQEFGYLDTCTELSHVFLRLLERYSKQNVDLQVRSRRRARKKKKQNQAADSPAAENEDRELEADDVAEAQRATSERKFDFTRFAARLINQASIDTFLAFLRHYKDLNEEQLKRAHRFFYRVAFKMDLAIYLFRLDIVALFNKIIKGPEGLDLANPTFKEWEELVRQVYRRLTKKLQDRPELAVELLFSKINSTMFYLEHGYERELPKKMSRPVAELEVKPGMDRAQQIGVVVSVLINQSRSDALGWLKNVLSSAALERKAWEDQAAARLLVEGGKNVSPDMQDTESPDGREGVQPTSHELQHREQPKPPSVFVAADNAERKLAMRKDRHLRLLLSLLGFQRLIDDEIDSIWTIPSSIPSTKLSDDVDLINKFEFEPPVYEDGKSAEDFLRRKAAIRTTKEKDDDDEKSSEGDSASDLDQLFPPGGPTARRSSASLAPDKPRRRRNKHSKDELLDAKRLAKRREAKHKAELEKIRKVKSELYVRESDDESDEERDRLFFSMEENRRRKAANGVLNTLRAESTRKKLPVTRKGASSSKKRRATTSEDNTDTEAQPSKRQRSGLQALLNDSDHGSDDSDDGLDFGSPISQDPTDRRPSDSSDEESSKKDSEVDTETGTPPSSVFADQSADVMHHSRRDDMDMDDSGVGDEDSDKENAGVAAAKPPGALSKRRSVRAGFILDSDDE